MRILEKLITFSKNIWTKRFLVTCGIILLLGIFAVLLALFLEYRHFIGDGGELQIFLEEHTTMFIFSALLIFLALLFLTGLTGKPIISIGLLFSVLTIITLIHINKFTVRNTPLLPEDFELASELTALSGMFSMTSLVKTIIAVVLAMFLSVLIQHFLSKKLKDVLKIKMPVVVITRIALVLASSFFMFHLTKDIRRNSGENFQTWSFLNHETYFVAWNQNDNYKINGFLVGFLYNLSPQKIEPPAGYGAETMQKIKTQYTAKSQEENFARLDIGDEDINIIMVLCESCVDMQDIENYYTHTGGDITPNLHKIQQKTVHGEMFSPEYGGGTANVEFEVLTGLSNYFYNVVPFVHTIPKTGNSPSIASFLKPFGYTSIGLHAYYPTMYKRDIVYKNLGFDGFYGFEEYSFQEKNGNSQYINDTSSYQEALSKLRTSDQKMLISLVTMENHMPYFDTYDEHHFVSTTTIEGTDHNQLENYYESLNNSDRALGVFISELDDFDEKTVVLFYGDHLPGIFGDLPPEAVYSGLRHKTPFFVYANFDIGEPQYVGTFSPNYLSSIMLDAINFQKSDRYYLLDDLKESSPILTRSFYNNFDPAPSQTLDAYELLNYDLLFGKRYWFKD